MGEEDEENACKSFPQKFVRDVLVVVMSFSDVLSL